VKLEDEYGDVEGGYQKEFILANQALKTSTWLNTFYLITTDILGKKELYQKLHSQ
jgi:hypothetical protein